MSFIRNFARIYVQFAVRHRIFIECPRFVSFDHGLAISSKSIVSVRSPAHTQESRVHRGVPGSLLNA